ncbi:MAG: hypothetical protein OEV40_25535, partial [Acidimicrobiia bacterium]|nr:hypothetical protein [Acidimicrobiia bacterium]
FVPSRPPDYLPEVLISSDLQLLAASPTEVRPLVGPFAGLAADRAVDDLLGGLVVQEPDAEGAGPGDVVWYRAEGGEPMVIDQAGAELLDVGYVGGSPAAVVLVGSDQVDRIRLVDNERTLMVTLEDEEQVLDLSASGGFHALVLANDRCGDLRFYAADGTRIDLNGPGEPDCIVPRRPAYGAVGLSPDAGAVVYTDVSYRDDGIEIATELVARELPSGTEYFRAKIGDDGDRITALSFDGERVAYLRQSETGVAVAVVDLSTEAETLIPLDADIVVDSVSFARLPLARS